jgi:hypothetical protein
MEIGIVHHQPTPSYWKEWLISFKIQTGADLGIWDGRGAVQTTCGPPENFEIYMLRDAISGESK